MEIFNTHTHINAKQFACDRSQALERAKKLGVTQMLVVAYDEESFAVMQQLCEHHANIYGAIGCHPENAQNYAWFKSLLPQAAKLPYVKAIGEIGLDYHTGLDRAHQQLQIAVFEAQLQLAERLKLPVCIHNRDAFSDTLSILKNAPLTYGCIMHSFNGDAKLAEQFLAAGCELSYSGVVTFSNAKDVYLAMQATPLEHLLVETDDPYLTPQPYRNEKNQPGMCRYTLEFIAQARHLTAEQLADITTRNAERIFQLDGIN